MRQVSVQLDGASALDFEELKAIASGFGKIEDARSRFISVDTVVDVFLIASSVAGFGAKLFDFLKSLRDWQASRPIDKRKPVFAIVDQRRLEVSSISDEDLNKWIADC